MGTLVHVHGYTGTCTWVHWYMYIGTLVDVLYIGALVHVHRYTGRCTVHRYTGTLVHCYTCTCIMDINYIVCYCIIRIQTYRKVAPMKNHGRDIYTSALRYYRNAFTGKTHNGRGLIYDHTH